MELHDALTQISEIRAQIARTETFRGYRSLTVAFSGLSAVIAASLQSLWIPNPEESIGSYLGLWIGVAVVSVLATGLEMAVRCHRAQSGWSARIAWMAVEQFLPCVLAGGMLTFAMVLFAEDSLWLLPGLWSILFSLGVFASCRLLPRHVFWGAVYYLVAGVFCIAWANGPHAFSPWAMAATFGMGQTLIALILYFTLERHGERQK